MLPYKYLSTACRVLLLLVTILIAVPAAAAQPDVSNLSAQTILSNVAAQMPNLIKMVTAIAYVMGMFFIFSGILKLKHVGESRTMMSQEHSVWGPIISIAVGAMLLYLPTSVWVGMSSFWTEPNPYGYITKQPNQWAEFLNDCFLLVQFVGVIAFIKGLVILSHVGGHSQQNPLGRGLTHVIGGIFCINIYQFVQVIFLTLGIQS